MKNRSRNQFIATIAACCLLLAGCAGTVESSTQSGETADESTVNAGKVTDESVTEESVTAANDSTETDGGSNVQGKIHFTDDEGREINLDVPASRIISFYSAHTENLYALGAEDKMIGNYKTETYPAAAAFMPMYDYTADPEKVIAANPDVALIRPFVTEKNPDFVDALEKAGIQVVSLYPETFEDFDDYIRKLAMLTGTEAVAEEKLDAFHNEIKEVSEQVAAVTDKQTVFFESTETNLRTVTPDSMAGLALQFAGAVNLAADAVPMSEGSTIAEFGEEKILEHANDIDVYISQRGAMNSGGNLISISERAGFDTIKAVQEDRVYLINEKIISSPTFRYVKGVHEVARFLYPELMDDTSSYAVDEPATRRDFVNIVVKSAHIPIYMPTSSKYYTTEQKGHLFGLFEDVPWTDEDFDAIESAVYSGYIEWEKQGEKEFYHPEEIVTREELAQTLFLMGDFEKQENQLEIKDISDCTNGRIVQTLVDNGVFILEDGKFDPQREVTKQEILDAMATLK